MSENLIPIGELPPFLKFCYTVGMLPTSYKISMTYEEQLLEAIRYIKEEIIPNVNSNALATKELQEKFVELVNYVETYLDNLDIQTEVNAKLDEMVEDGTLEELLDHLVVNNKLGIKDNQQMNLLGMKRVLRTLERNASHPNHVAGEDYAVLQGGTYTGNNKMVIARIRRNNLNDTLLQEISLDSGRVIRETTLQLAHANGITFDPINNKLYVASLTLNINDEDTPLHEIYVINYIDFTLERTIVLDSLEQTEGVHSVSYDIITNKFYVATEDTSLSNAITLYEMNLATYELTKIELVDYTGLLSTSNNNDILVYDNIFYLMKFNPQVLICYDLSTLELRNIYNIDRITHEGFSIGELENLSIKYDTDLKNLIFGSYHVETYNGWYNIFQYFEANTVYNICENIPLSQNALPSSRTLIVDINSTSINPNGTSANPFKHIGEALDLAQIKQGYINIVLKPGEYPPFTYMGGNCMVQISKSEEGTIENTIIDGVRFERTGNYVYMLQVSINNIENNNSDFYSNYDLYVDFSSKLRIADIKFISNRASQHIFARRSTIEFVSLTYINTLFYTMSNPTLICLDTIPDYNYYNNGTPQINKPIQVVPLTQLSNSVVEVDITKYKDFMFESGTWIIQYHGDYSYKKISLPVNNNDTGSRITSIDIYSKLIELSIINNKPENKISFKIDRAISLRNLTPTNVTDSTTGDLRLFYVPEFTH